MTHGAAFADFDDDGRIDVVAATENGIALYRNTGARRFDDATAASGLPATGAWGTVVVGDYDNDGALDVLATRRGEGAPELWRNDGTGKFTRDDRSIRALGRLAAVSDLHAEFVDVDNDGWLDLVLAGKARAAGQRGAYLLRNDRSGKYRDASNLLPATVGAGSAMAQVDVDNDGDMDLLVGDERGVHLLANEGGNTKLGLQVTLAGLRTGSGKNNDFGIGAKLELRAGELHQTRVVTEPRDALRPRARISRPTCCASSGLTASRRPCTSRAQIRTCSSSRCSRDRARSLYTWDGTRLPLRDRRDVAQRVRHAAGAHGADDDGATMYAPAGASQEYLRIPGDALQPRERSLRRFSSPRSCGRPRTPTR